MQGGVPRPTVLLASKSAVKQAAVREAFPAGCFLLCEAADSGVPSQPVGKEETLQGARNRLAGALAMRKRKQQKKKDAKRTVDFAVAIENGIWENQDGLWEDAAAVIVYDNRNDTEQVGWSDALVICSTPHCRKPCAHPDIPPGPDGEWSALKDPHAVFGRPRQDYLAALLRQMLAEHQSK